MEKTPKEMTNDELKYWLTSTDDAALEWRTNQANWGLRDSMTEEARNRQYEARSTGVRMERIIEPTSQIRYAAEERELRNRAANQARYNAREQELKKLVWEQRQEFQTRGEFDAQWPDYFKKLVDSGEASKVLDQARTAKRRKAARTF